MRRRPSQTRFAVSLSFVGWPSCRLLAWLSLACYRWLQGHAAGSVMDGRASGLGFWIHFSLVGHLELRRASCASEHRGAVVTRAVGCHGWMLCLTAVARVCTCVGAAVEGVLGTAFPTLSRLRTDWTHIDIDWDSLDLPVPGSLELMRVRQGRANRTASVSLSISPSPLAVKA